PLIAERAARAGWKLFLLGAAEGVAAKAADILKARYPGLKIAGTYSGSPAPEDEDALVERINASGADILFVAYGAPEQDKWIARNLPRLDMQDGRWVWGTRWTFIRAGARRLARRSGCAAVVWNGCIRLYLQPRRIGRMLRLPRFALLVLLRGERA
ncbi:WecB/TagA/CpsF family glycosyltransferase, partial [Oscillatoria laete-virens NRMC-F 0139]